MIVSHRVTELGGRPARLETHAAFTERLRIHAVRNEGIVSDDRLSTLAFPRLGKVGRPVVTIVLEGAARIEAFSKAAWLEPGMVSVVEAKGAILMRQSREGETYSAVVIEWDAPDAADRPVGFETATWSGDDFAVVTEMSSTLCSRDAALAPRAARALAELLVRHGIPLRVPADDELRLTTDKETLDLSSALDDLLSAMGDRPMIVDLHERLRVSARTANRLVQGFNARYGFNASTWQDARSRRRVLLGAALLTARGATATEVAATMGYASLAAFTHALRKAGMPPPRDIPAFVRELGLRDRISGKE